MTRFPAHFLTAARGRFPRGGVKAPAAAAIGTLVLLAGLLAPSLALAQTPGNHARWIGTLEGSAVSRSGGGVVYDVRFDPTGVATVEKSTGADLVTQRFQWTESDGVVQLSGAVDGPIPELARATLTSVEGRHFDIALPGGATLTLRRTSTPLALAHWVFLFFVVLLGNELCRHSKAAAYTVFFVLPVVLIPVFLNSGFDGVFRWVKLYSAVAGAAFFTLVRFNGLDRFKWARFTVAAILVVNILEAVTQDYSSGTLPNLLNAAAGILNAVTVSRWAGIVRDERAPHDMLWPGMTLGWIIAYDLWNITIVYLNFPNTVMFTLAILVAPTLAALVIKKGTWMQARAYTLAIYMMYIFTFHRLAEHTLSMQFALPFPRSYGVAMGLALLSLGANVGYALLQFRWRLTGKAPSFLEVGQTASVI